VYNLIQHWDKDAVATGADASRRQCSLLLFIATPAEEEALRVAAQERQILFEEIKDSALGDYHWLGDVGNETVIAIRPVRENRRLVMGAIGRLGSAARAVRFREATGAQAIIQLGMAFGIDRSRQKHGDVLVSSSLVPYDTRDVVAAGRWTLRRLSPGYHVRYSDASREPARQELVNLFLRQQQQGNQSFRVHVGAMLSGAARIHSRRFREELIFSVPKGDDPIVGGEMEGVGLLAASTARDDPVWCVVKGISDFADERRKNEIDRSRPVACRNAADFVLAALQGDAARQ